MSTASNVKTLVDVEPMYCLLLHVPRLDYQTGKTGSSTAHLMFSHGTLCAESNQTACNDWQYSKTVLFH